MMSFGWFIGLHVPILWTLCMGNTTLARSMWPEKFFNDDKDGPPVAHPQPHSIWYPVLFFALLAFTAVMYFTAALSYPGYVDEEYRKHKLTDDVTSPEARGRNGYARVDAAGEASSSSSNGPVDDVRIDMHTTQVRRIVVDEGGIDANAAATEASDLSSPSIPASMIGEATEAAELSIGCTPPVALPLLQSFGLSRAQIHASDQTVSDHIALQTVEIIPGEEESSRLTESSPSEVELGQMSRGGALAAVATNAVASPSNQVVPATRALTAQSQTTATGYCSMCRLVRPARAKHCYKCRHCISKFDHHCPFVANCIGARNHRYFLIYLWCQVLTMVWGCTLNVEPYLYAYTPQAFYGHAATMIIMVGQLMVSLMLCMFHTWLALTNQTTYQVIQMQDSMLTQTPEAVSVRRMQRRQRSRQMGEHSSDEDDDPEEAVRLTWSTYHVGFFYNVWRFCRGIVPSEHALPRSILDEDGAWVQLPHAVEVVEVVRPAAIPERPMPAGRSTVVNLTYHGATLPTTPAEVSAFSVPDTPPSTEPREAYTRPARIIAKGHHPTPAKPIEPDTDDDPVESVRL